MIYEACGTLKIAGDGRGSASYFTWMVASITLTTPVLASGRAPRNIGSNGLIFDPALHPIQEGVYWTGFGVIVVGGGAWAYFRVQANE